MPEPILKPIIEPVRVAYNPNHCDFWFMRRPNLELPRDFQKGDRLYVIRQNGDICGHAPRRVQVWMDEGGLWFGALIHTYGDDVARPGNDGPVDGERLWLRWSGGLEFPIIDTVEPLVYGHWKSIRIYPVLPGE